MQFRFWSGPPVEETAPAASEAEEVEEIEDVEVRRSLRDMAPSEAAEEMVMQTICRTKYWKK